VPGGGRAPTGSARSTPMTGAAVMTGGRIRASASSGPGAGRTSSRSRWPASLRYSALIGV